MHSVEMSERSRWEDAIRKNARKEADTRVRPFRRKSVGKKSHHRSKISVRDLAWYEKQQRRVLCWECRWRVQSSRNSEIGTSRQMGQKAIRNVIGVPWRMTDGRWTADRPEVQVDPIPIPPLPFEGVRIQRERITKQDIDEFGATIGCPGCNAIKDNKRAQAHSDRCRKRIEESLRNTPHGADRLNRRDEVINEALAEKVRRGDQRKKRSEETTTEVTGVGSTAPEPMAESAAPGLRENPIEPDPNPKRRLLMKSVSLTASGSGQQREKRPTPDGEFKMQTEAKREEIKLRWRIENAS